MGISSTFRGVIGSDGWVREDEMEYQHSGGLAEGLRSAGVKCVILGDVRDEVSSCDDSHDKRNITLRTRSTGPFILVRPLRISCRILSGTIPPKKQKPSCRPIQDY
jgi:hypothetical protein